MATEVRDARVSNVRPIIAVDWDGTLVTQTWPEQSREWMPGAVEAMHELAKHARLIVFTSRIAPLMPDLLTRRTEEQIAAEVNYIREMLDSVGLTMVDIHTHPWKPGALAYVDDKAERYTGRPGSWRAMKEKLLARIEADG